MSNTSTPPTAYVVTDGDYSDYHVVAVFADRVNAQAFIEAGGGDDILEEPFRRVIPEKCTLYTMLCRVPYDGEPATYRKWIQTSPGNTTPAVEADIPKPWWIDYEYTNRVWDPVPTVVVHQGEYHRNGTEIKVKGTDRERVRKVYGDAKARVRAEIEGLT